MKLFIDEKELDIDQNTNVSISLSIASVNNIETARTGYSKNIRVPMTTSNSNIMGDVDQFYAVKMFNQQQHTARIEENGCVVISGVPMITKYETEPNGDKWYNINIIGAGKEWVEMAAKTPFRKTQVQFQMTITAHEVYQTWLNKKDVRFLPVQRETLKTTADTIQGGVRIITFTDYHPFISVKTLMNQIANQAGYTIESRFIESQMFESLYMSGKYPEKETEIIRDRMNFLAKKIQSSEANADTFGRVYADPFTPLNSVGNIVDSADPEEIINGTTIVGVFNTNNCFRKNNNRIAFYPTESVNIGFEYTVRYITEYIIEDRMKLKAFDRLYLEDNIERQYTIMNKNQDRRNEMKENFQYQIFAFNFIQGDEFMFSYDCVTNQNADMNNLKQSDYVTISNKFFKTRVAEVKTVAGYRLTNPKLSINAQGTYIQYNKDWAIYDGYIEEKGSIEVEITARSAAARVTPTQPRYFDLLHFGGANPGMKIKIIKASLKPIFIPHPCEGMSVKFEDIAAHNINQIDFVNAIKHMFNLYFYTESLTKTIFIEPRQDFYSKEIIVDWSQKIDAQKQITCEELGADIAKIFTIRYKPGDGSVARWDESNNQVIGLCSLQIKNIFAKKNEKIYYNPIFTPGLNKTQEYPDAPDASILQVGDRPKGTRELNTENLNFEPKIVKFLGITNLPQNQYWGWPSFSKIFPKIAFHAPENEFTLCFEDRDQMKGLHSYYDKNIELYNTGKKITAYIDLKPEDVEPFIVPNHLKKDFRALFKINVNAESIMCRLEEIIDYNPNSRQSTKCIFIKDV